MVVFAKLAQEVMQPKGNFVGARGDRHLSMKACQNKTKTKDKPLKRFTNVGKQEKMVTRFKLNKRI